MLPSFCKKIIQNSVLSSQSSVNLEYHFLFTNIYLILSMFYFFPSGIPNRIKADPQPVCHHGYSSVLQSSPCFTFLIYHQHYKGKTMIILRTFGLPSTVPQPLCRSFSFVVEKHIFIPCFIADGKIKQGRLFFSR